jgi:hypothetical protein
MPTLGTRHVELFLHRVTPFQISNKLIALRVANKLIALRVANAEQSRAFDI